MLTVRVNIFPSALNSLRGTSIKNSPDETGGVIVGTRACCYDVLEFNILGILGVADCEEFKDIYDASPTEFVCTNRLGWANLALRAVKTFGMSYIGDWHSHPNSSLTTLSSRDIQHMFQQYMLGQFAPFPPLHLLLSWQSSGTDFRVSTHTMLGKSILVIEPRIIANPRIS